MSLRILYSTLLVLVSQNTLVERLLVYVDDIFFIGNNFTKITNITMLEEASN